jgi:hypothetical protein
MLNPTGRPISPPSNTPVHTPSRLGQTQATTAPRTPVSNPKAFQAGPSRPSTGPVNASHDGQQIKDTLGQRSPTQLQSQSQALLESPAVAEAFGPVARPALSADLLTQARANLKPVSQHQVLNLGDVSTGSTVKESSISRKLGSEVGGSPLDRDRLPHADGSIDIVGHSLDGGKTIEGKSPKQLAELLKQQFGLQQIKTIHLVSCQSEQFKAEFQQALAEVGIQAGTVEAATGKVAVERTTGKMLDAATVGNLANIDGHDGELGWTIQTLTDAGKITAPELKPLGKFGNVQIIPFVNPQASPHSADALAVAKQVGDAVHTAFSEFMSGALISNLANSKAFPSSHVKPFLPGNEAEKADLFANGTPLAKFGYLIEDRVTQLLIESGDFSKHNFQQAIGKSRPDIVVGSIRVDLTAEASMGHILGKDPKAWFDDGNQSFEVTYPSLPQLGIRPDQLSRLLSPGAAIDAGAIRALQEKHAQEEQLFSETIANEVAAIIQPFRTDPSIFPKLNAKDNAKKHFADYVASKLDPDGSISSACGVTPNTLAKNFLGKFGISYQGNTYSVAKGSEEQITRTVRGIFARNGVDTALIRNHLYSSRQDVHDSIEG